MANTLKITQVRSVARKPARQKKTMVALGLRRMHHTVELADTPQIRGMIARVSHLVEVESSTAGSAASSARSKGTAGRAAADTEESAAPAKGKGTSGRAPADTEEPASPAKGRGTSGRAPRTSGSAPADTEESATPAKGKGTAGRAPTDTE